MLKSSLVLLLVFLVPCVVFGGEPVAKFIAIKHIDQNHMFAYRCMDTGNVVEVEQRYNPNARSEEVRFLVDGQHGEWLTKGINSDLYRYFMRKACDESTSQAVATIKD